MQHTIPVDVMVQEEKVVIAEAEKAVFGAANPKLFGTNGEKVLLRFLRKYMPSCFRLTSGHVLRADGVKSPEIDLMLVDSRFAPLSVHEDDTTLEMMESVLSVVSVKKRLDKAQIEEQDRYATRVYDFFASNLKGQHQHSPVFYIIVYRCEMLEDTVLKHLRDVKGLSNPLFSIFCLQMPQSDQARKLGPGAIFRYDGTTNPTLFSVFSTAPLSDFYFMMLQDAYYAIAERQIDFTSLGEILMRYYNWGRADPEVIKADEQKRRGDGK